jgi:predicted esterase
VLEGIQAGAFKDSNKGTRETWLQRDDAKDVCRIYVPASYNGTVPYGLVLFVNPGGGGIPGHWRALFDEMKLIVVSADHVGNDQPMIRRVLLSMDALATAEKQYKIDPKRRVVSGLSGGGHMAMLIAAMYPDYFLGAISHAAQSYLPSYSADGGHFPGMDLRDFKRGTRDKLKWVVISGDKDFNYAEIQKTSGQWEDAKLTYRFINIPGMGHVNAEAGPMKEALQWVGL